MLRAVAAPLRRAALCRTATLRQALRRHFFPHAAFSSSLPEHAVLPMPALSPTMTEGNLAAWHVKQGDEVAAGEAIAEIETDKATVAFETTDDGFIAKILVPEGAENVPVGTAVAVLVEEADDIAAFADFSAPVEVPEEGAAAEAETKAPPAETQTRTQEAALSSTQSAGRQPLIQFRHGNRAAIVADMVSAQDHSSSTKSSAESSGAPAAPVAAPSPADASYTDSPASNMRKVIASRLTESKSMIPHFYITQECDITDVSALRKRLAPIAKVSLNDFVIRAAALALRDVPVANRSLSEASGVTQQNDSVDISVAVATEGGLITPIVTNADHKSVAQINSDVKDLAGRARAGTLAPTEYQGGSFSISNLGMFGVDHFSAVINPPQGIIMAVGGGVPTLKKDPDSGLARTRTMMTVRLSCDRRIVDEAMAAQLAQAFRHYLQEPDHLIL